MAIYPPQENLTYTTKLSPSELLERLQEASSYDMLDAGNNSFTIKRFINYKNSFLPEIKGQIEEGYMNTTIKVAMRPNKFVSIFMTIWLSFVVLFCFIWIGLSIGEDFDIFTAIPFVMIVLGTVMFYGAFKYESRKSIKDLQELFEAEIRRTY